VAQLHEDSSGKQMKLLFVHQNLGAFGGAEANILLTARELQPRGHNVALLLPSDATPNYAL